MTKRELIWFLEPFTDEIEVRSECGCDLSVKYVITPDGEGTAVITTRHVFSYEKRGDAV